MKLRVFIAVGGISALGSFALQWTATTTSDDRAVSAEDPAANANDSEMRQRAVLETAILSSPDIVSRDTTGPMTTNAGRQRAGYSPPPEQPGAYGVPRSRAMSANLAVHSAAPWLLDDEAAVRLEVESQPQEDSGVFIARGDSYPDALFALVPELVPNARPTEDPTLAELVGDEDAVPVAPGAVPLPGPYFEPPEDRE